VAVFLDDLDRCNPKRVVEAINLFFDLPGVCFFLGLHWERLAEVLPDAVRSHADEFLEKIVQVSFELPEVGERDATGYVEELVRDTPVARSCHLLPQPKARRASKLFRGF
jgi:hypothetical protein